MVYDYTKETMFCKRDLYVYRPHIQDRVVLWYTITLAIVFDYTCYALSRGSTPHPPPPPTSRQPWHTTRHQEVRLEYFSKGYTIVIIFNATRRLYTITSFPPRTLHNLAFPHPPLLHTSCQQQHIAKTSPIKETIFCNCDIIWRSPTIIGLFCKRAP